MLGASLPRNTPMLTTHKPIGIDHPSEQKRTAGNRICSQCNWTAISGSVELASNSSTASQLRHTHTNTATHTKYLCTTLNSIYFICYLMSLYSQLANEALADINHHRKLLPVRLCGCSEHSIHCLDSVLHCFRFHFDVRCSPAVPTQRVRSNSTGRATTQLLERFTFGSLNWRISEWNVHVAVFRAL